jgi:hypothetical protein
VTMFVARGYIVSDARHDNLLKRILRHLALRYASFLSERNWTNWYVRQPD